VAQLKIEILMLFLENAEGFRATIGALRYLDESEVVSFHAFSLLFDRFVHLVSETEERGDSRGRCNGTSTETLQDQDAKKTRH
jgi:hypothetical protein